MKKVGLKELKNTFIDALSDAKSLSFDKGNPFNLEFNSSKYFIFIKNLSPAYFRHSPDVTRIQLHYDQSFNPSLSANVPILVFGFDAEHDSLVCWDPNEIQGRINTKNNVSLYSRGSVHSSVTDEKIVIGELTSGGKFACFKREKLPTFLSTWDNLFEGSLSANASKFESRTEKGKIFEITDKALLKKLSPLVRKNKFLEAVELLMASYKGKHNKMTFNDWFAIIKKLAVKLEQKKPRQ